ncbi:MAG: hypothetical protein ACLFNM_02415 [Candidatus Woesearchaeota archaeon]
MKLFLPFKRSSKKGQAALEYLITYGWAFLVILAAVGVLGYFGLLNPGKYIPESCEFGEQLKCVDYSVQKSSANQTVEFRFRNNFGEDIRITAVDGDGLSLTGGYVQIPSGEVKRISCQHDQTFDWSVGNKERFDVQLTFNRVGGSNNYNISGSLFAEVIDTSLV